jgi:hypothetical protein
VSRRAYRLNRGRIAAPVGDGGAAPVAALYFSGEAIDSTQASVAAGFGTTAQYGYATDDTNCCITSHNITSSPVNGDIFCVWGNSAGFPVGLLLPAAAATPSAIATGTSVLASLSDDHNALSVFVDATGVPHYLQVNHSSQEKYWRGSSSTDITLTDAKLVSPRVNATREAASTYHDPLPLPSGEWSVEYRFGGSGNGNQVEDILDVTGAWSNLLPAYLDGEGVRSFYMDHSAVDWAGANPGRVYRSCTPREGAGASTAHDKFLIYRNPGEAFYRDYNDNALPASAKLSDLTNAKTLTIPSADSDPNYSFFFGIQGMNIDPTGRYVVQSYYYGPATASSGGAYGTPTGGLTIYATKIDMVTKAITTVAARTFAGFGTTTLEVSRPTVTFSGSKACLWYSARFDTDAAGTGKMYVTTLDLSTMVVDGHREMSYRHDINDVASSTFVYDKRLYYSTGGLRAFWMKTRNNAAQAANSPAVMTITANSSAPTDMTYAEAYGGTIGIVADSRFATDDGSGKASAIIDQGPGAVALTQATAGFRPTINASGLNSKQTLTYDGADDFIGYTRAISAPGTTPHFIYAIMRQLSWTSGDRLWDINNALAFQTGASPSVRSSHGTSAASVSAGPTNTWRRVYQKFSNAATDNIWVGATSGTQAIAGNNVTAAGAIGASSAGTVAANVEIAVLMDISGTLPTNQKIWRFDGISRKVWGAAAVV